MFTRTRKARGLRSSLLAVTMFVAASCARESIHATPQADDHHDPSPVAITQFHERMSLYVEYPRMTPDTDARFLAHFTWLDSGKPLSEGSVVLELEGPGGALTFEAPAPTRDGLFIPVANVAAAGNYAGTLTARTSKGDERFDLGTVVVYADAGKAHDADHAESGEAPEGEVAFLLEQQWKVGLLTSPATRTTLVERLQVPGDIEAPHHAIAAVSAPLAGTLFPPDDGHLPCIGDWVEKGQLLAYIEPPLSTSDAAQLANNATTRDVLEMELLMREFDVQAKSLEVEQSLAQAQAQVQFAQRAFERIRALRGKELGTKAEFEAAERDLEIAQQSLESARALQQAFLAAGNKLRDLQQASKDLRDATASENSRRHALIAPISGEIVEADHIEGEHLDATTEIYRLVNLSRVWFEAHVPEFDLGRLPETPGALVRPAAFPDWNLDVLGAMGGEFLSFGRIVNPETRTVRLIYEADNPENKLRNGMFADVFVETSTRTDTIAIPESAVVMDGGRPVAFVVSGGESFLRRELTLGIRDGELIEVLDGVAAGERVVTKGAYLVKLAALAPAEIGHGHTH